MQTPEDFLAAIKATPDDDAPRLIYADWLEEQGQQARADYIRLSCRWAAMRPRYRKERDEALQLERECKWLLRKHELDWLESGAVILNLLQRRPGVRKREHAFERIWQRGFLEELRCTPEVWVEHGAAAARECELLRCVLPLRVTPWHHLTVTQSRWCWLVPRAGRLGESSTDRYRLPWPIYACLKSWYDASDGSRDYLSLDDALADYSAACLELAQHAPLQRGTHDGRSSPATGGVR